MSEHRRQTRHEELCRQRPNKTFKILKYETYVQNKTNSIIKNIKEKKTERNLSNSINNKKSLLITWIVHLRKNNTLDTFRSHYGNRIYCSYSFDTVEYRACSSCKVVWCWCKMTKKINKHYLLSFKKTIFICYCSVIIPVLSLT